MRSLVAPGDAVYPESPRWHEGELWFSDVHDYRVKAVSENGLRTVAEVPGRPAGLGFADGVPLVAAARDHGLYAIRDGELEERADLSDLADGLLNDMVVDPRGRAYVGDTGFDLGRGDAKREGKLILVPPGGEPRVVADDVWFPNGSVVDAACTRLWLAETFADRISVFDIAPDGTLGPRETFAELGASPDGMCSDGAGGFWVALIFAGAFAHVGPSGELLGRIASPSPFAVACALVPGPEPSFALCSADTTIARAAQGDSIGRIDIMQAARGESR
jgi:sugar lactone lactonase YvrE